MSSSVLRRYTPPTCTLEVAAIGSALSRWTEQEVLKNLRFELSFDDPKMNSAQQVTIQGDRNQLEALWEAVSGYVQSLLLHPMETLGQPSDRVGQIEGYLNGDGTGDPLQMTQRDQEDLPNTVDPLHDAGINLQPQGNLNHALHLGTLASEAAAVIPLTTLQLFDLANALDEYHAEALTLPSLGRPRWLSVVPKGWMQVAAAAVLVVGVSVPMVRFITNLSAPQTVNTASTKDVEISTAQRAGDLPAPVSPGATPPPLTLTPLKPPAPPPVGTTVFPAPVPGVPSLPKTPSSPAPAQPTTIEIPGEPNLSVVPRNSPSAASAPPTDAETTPPRLEGTGDGEDVAPPTATPDAATPDAANSVDNQLAAAGLAAPESSANTRSLAGSSERSAAIPASSNQAEEVKTYFQQKWQPPQGLTDTLEYRLLLNADGSLQRILPLGNASANFLDRTNMPLLGEPFVSPTIDGKKPQIRVVLEPDGNVKTFLEYAE
jgi:Domain of unknown function (DUF4335)